MTASKFYKRGMITAEQFDGSDEMMSRYKIELNEDSGYGGEEPGPIIETLEGYLHLSTSDWIATGVNGEHWPIADDIFRKTYQVLPLIPEKVCELISAMKKKGYSLFQSESPTISIILLREPPKKSQQISQWVQDNQDTFALAWLLDDTEADND